MRGRVVHILFDIGMIGKAVDGVLEVIGGVALLFVQPDQIGRLARMLTQHELSEDPNDVIAGLISRSVQHLSADTTLFAALFLLWHGVIKVGLVVAVLRKHLWAYPTAIVAFAVFTVYQLYRYSLTHSSWLLALSVLDVFVVVLTWMEYKRVRSEWAKRRVVAAGVPAARPDTALRRMDSRSASCHVPRRGESE